MASTITLMTPAKHIIIPTPRMSRSNMTYNAKWPRTNGRSFAPRWTKQNVGGKSVDATQVWRFACTNAANVECPMMTEKSSSALPISTIGRRLVRTDPGCAESHCVCACAVVNWRCVWGKEDGGYYN